jgi:MFS family permease
MFISSIIIEDHLPKTNDISINQQIAGRLIAIPFLISTIFSPLTGIYVDTYGQRLNLLFLSIFLMLVGYIQLLYFYPLVSMAFIGISLTIFSTVLWATTCFLVNYSCLGMALGIMTAL